MAAFRRSHILLHNPSMNLEIALEGGAITDFHLNNGNLNPLTFAFSRDQMPERNRNGAPYRGHFLCLGRWGEPSNGEKKSGLPDHGQFANQYWQSTDSGHNFVSMFAESTLEGLRVERQIHLHEKLPLYGCSETVFNNQPLGKIFNMVQHPTIAAPFLDTSTRVFCNAEKGFPFLHYREIEKYTSVWPSAVLSDKSIADLSYSTNSITDVHSFVVDSTSELGWIIAYTPENNLLLGYLWKRSDYPWINMWRDFDGEKIRYRGLEFGTTGVHQPFPEIMAAGCYEVYGEKVFNYIDSGESVTKKFCSFQVKSSGKINKIEKLFLLENRIEINCGAENFSLELPAGFNF